MADVKFKLEGPVIHLDFRTLLDWLDEEQARELGEELGGYFIEQVTNDIISGRVVSDTYNSEIFKARTRLMEAMATNIYERHILSMLKMVEQARSEEQRHRSWAWALWHYMQERNRMWFDSHGFTGPNQPYPEPPKEEKFVYTPWLTDDQVSRIRAIMEEPCD